jgi:hypothetical protein
MTTLVEVLLIPVIPADFSFPQRTMVLTQSQRHWRAWVKALQTRDASVRAEALGQLTKFLDYWTAELYILPASVRGLLNGHDTPQPESWDEVFNVDTDLILRSRRQPQIRFDPDEAWVCSFITALTVGWTIWIG